MRQARSLTENLRNPLFVDLRLFACSPVVNQPFIQYVLPLQGIVGGFVVSPYFAMATRMRDGLMAGQTVIFPSLMPDEESGAKIILPTYLGDMPQYTQVTAEALTSRRISAFTVCADKPIIKAAIDGRKKALDSLAEISLEKGYPFEWPGPAILVQIYLSHYSAEQRPNLFDKILKRVEVAVEAKADGVIISGQELERVRTNFPEVFIAVGGIRPEYLSVENDDQARAITVSEALPFADILLVGRPITQSNDPVTAVKMILTEIETFQRVGVG